jgi:predicted aspartyl protease
MIKEMQVPKGDGTTETYVIIDHGNDEFTTMPKSVYEEMIERQEAAKPLQ